MLPLARPPLIADLARVRVIATGEDPAVATAAVQADPDAAAESYRRVLWRFVRDGGIATLPAKRAARSVVLVEAGRLFEADHPYPETEVNEVLRPVYEDVAYLRRELVEVGVLVREHAAGTLLYTRAS